MKPTSTLLLGDQTTGVTARVNWSPDKVLKDRHMGHTDKYRIVVILSPLDLYLKNKSYEEFYF